MKEPLSPPEGKAMEIRHGLIFRNTALNFFGLVVPLAAGFAAIPFVVRALGAQRFGILSLVWVVFGYFGLFDLGLGRTTTKYAAEALGRGEPEKLPGYLWTAVALQTAIGAAGTLLLVLLAPAITLRFLKIPPEFVPETVATLRLVGWSLPVMFVSSSFRGVLEAAQRFDLVNAVKVPVNVLFYVLPLVGQALGFGLPGIVVLLIVSRAAGLIAWGGLSLRVFPALRARPRLAPHLVRPLFSFSGWLALSSVLYAGSSSLDRLVIGAVLTVSAVTFYSAPYEAINRIGVVPGSLAMVLFPAFSSLDGGRLKERTEDLFARSVRLLLLTTGPVLILLIFFARDFLRLWLGADFARTSTLAVQILAAGFLVNSVIAVPNNYLMGIGRVDIAPKYQLVELVAYAGLAWAGAKLWGINGVALASALRLAAFSLVLFAASFTVGKIGWLTFWRTGARRAVAALGLFAAGLGVDLLAGFSLVGAAVLTAGFLAVAYFRLIEESERDFLRARFFFWRASGRPAAAGPGSDP
ncbi:MAG TPA: flippase [Burkholderiales bacterium]|nr:flippase [Burkholderiales bacterium]